MWVESGPVVIPEEAIEAGAKAISGGARGMAASRQRAEKVLAAAAPLIVAAELERLADQVESQPLELVDLMGAGKQYNAGKGYVAGLLRQRARELRASGPGPAGQPGLRWTGRALAYAQVAVEIESRILTLEDAAGSGVVSP